jgi:hypothetical protein
MISRRPFQFSAPENKWTPETSPKQKLNPEPLTSGDSDFESATGSPAPKLTEQRESLHLSIDELIESSRN